MGKQEILISWQSNAQRDWGHAKDYVEAMWKMLQTEKPDIMLSLRVEPKV